MADPTAITIAFDNRLAVVRSRVLAYIERAWGSLDNWRDADIARFVKLVTPMVEGGQAQTATLTDAYLSAYLTAVSGARVAPVGIPAKTVTTMELRGVTTAEAFERAGVTTRMAIADKVPFVQAAARGLARANDIASTNLQLAKTHTTRTILEGNGHVVGYRRVLHGKSCVLCRLASTQRYHKDRLMPIHPGCDCGIAPIIGHHDPGQVIAPAELASIHEEAVVHEHGEIGPVLAVAGQHFDTA